MKSLIITLVLLVIKTFCLNDTFIIMEVNDQMTSRVSRTIKTVATTPKNPMWGGYTRIVSPNLKDFDPFIFLAHHTHKFGPGERSGFPAHAHRYAWFSYSHLIEKGIWNCYLHSRWGIWPQRFHRKFRKIWRWRRSVDGKLTWEIRISFRLGCRKRRSP